MEVNRQGQGVSYRDKVAGAIPRAFEEAFRINGWREDDAGDDIEAEEENGLPSVALSQEEKLRIRAPWREALIVRLMGKQME